MGSLLVRIYGWWVFIVGDVYGVCMELLLFTYMVGGGVCACFVLDFCV